MYLSVNITEINGRRLIDVIVKIKVNNVFIAFWYFFLKYVNIEKILTYKQVIIFQVR